MERVKEKREDEGRAGQDSRWWTSSWWWGVEKYSSLELITRSWVERQSASRWRHWTCDMRPEIWSDAGFIPVTAGQRGKKREEMEKRMNEWEISERSYDRMMENQKMLTRPKSKWWGRSSLCIKIKGRRRFLRLLRILNLFSGVTLLMMMRPKKISASFFASDTLKQPEMIMMMMVIVMLMVIGKDDDDDGEEWRKGEIDSSERTQTCFSDRNSWEKSHLERWSSWWWYAAIPVVPPSHHFSLSVSSRLYIFSSHQSTKFKLLIATHTSLEFSSSLDLRRRLLVQSLAC